MTNFPDSSQTKTNPKVLPWFKLYCVLMSVLYLLVIAIGVVFILVPAGLLDMDDFGAKLIGAIYCIMGLVLFVPFAVAPLFPARPWSWIYGIVLICIGMTSCCTLPFCIPLLISWIKPENRKYFGKE